MPLPLKPHTLTLIEASETIGGDSVVQSTDFTETAVTVKGQLTPMRVSAAFEKYGVEVKAPHEFLFEIADVAKVKLGNRLRKGGRIFVVETVPAIWDAEPRTKHAYCLMNDLTASGPVE
jgi:hypothetical protein